MFIPELVRNVLSPVPVTLARFQLARFWLNSVAPWNMLFVDVHRLIFQLLSGWLKAAALINILAAVQAFAVGNVQSLMG